MRIVHLVFSLAAIAASSPVLSSEKESEIRLDPSTLKAMSRPDPITEVAKDGTVQTRIEHGYGHVFLARIGEDGKMETYCTQHEATAKAFLRGDLEEQP